MVLEVNGLKIGSKEFVVIAGPCAIESKEQLLKTAQAVKKAGAKVLRGSAYKPRTSPKSFQGLGEKGLEIMKEVKKETGLLVETEVLDPRHLEKTSEVVDILRIGSRNMQNFELLKELAKQEKPIILKNGLSATLEEFLGAADYLGAGGNKDIILCYRGIRSFEPSTRFALDIGMIQAIKERTEFPVIVDPSHAAGKTSLVPSISKAALAAGADGLLIEVHPQPEKALSDAKQQLTIPQFEQLMGDLKQIAPVVGKAL